MKSSANNLTYGYKELDSLTGGLHPGELILVGARPGMGSSRFMYNVLARLCVNDHIPSVFSSEESPAEYMFRILGVYCDLPGVEASNADSLTDGLTVSNSTFDIAEIEECIRESSFSVAVLDGVRLVKYGDGNEAGTPINFGDFFVRLKRLAVELSIPIIIVAKWPRICETRIKSQLDARPLLDDFSATAVSKDDFDTILFLYRDDYYLEDDDLFIPHQQTDMMEVIVSKSLCKNGGICKLHYEPKTGYISDMK